MTLTQLALHDVRNYPALDFAPEPGLNLVYGDNAQGKSNLLEAIAMVATGKSFRTAREREVVAEGALGATLSGEALTQAGTVRLTCTVLLGASGARKTYAVNGAKVRYAGYLGRLHVVTFVPEDLDVIGGAPAKRRALLNAALAQQNPAYYVALAAYTRDLEQKNALLRGAIGVDEELLATYDERLIRSGAVLMEARARFVAELAPAAREAYARWTDPDSALDVLYRPNVPLEAHGSGAITAALRARFESMRRTELARGHALVGPHRDDLEVTLAGRPLAAFGSQGERRSAVLALKLAEYRVLAEHAGEAPILLLDDVLSELDPQRQATLLAMLVEFEQSFVTTTREEPRARARAAYRVADAKVERVA